VREYLQEYPPSSPSVALFRAGMSVFMLQWHEIEHQDATEIAESLTEAFDQFCGPRPSEQSS
jgi:putative YphP/YqiW family bacilliredoxin